MTSSERFEGNAVLETTQVNIVGAGPVGLTLAFDLGRRGRSAGEQS
jgi:NADPH-dependent glutamate synthase beta subunit-like oxidoreductase